MLSVSSMPGNDNPNHNYLLSFSSNKQPSAKLPTTQLPNLGNFRYSLPRTSARSPSTRVTYSARSPSTRVTESPRSPSMQVTESARSPSAIPEEVVDRSQKFRNLIKTLIQSNFKKELDGKLHYKKKCGIVLQFNKDDCIRDNQLRIITFVESVENAISPTQLDENFDIKTYYDNSDPEFQRTVEQINISSIDELDDPKKGLLRTIGEHERIDQKIMQKFKFIFAKLSDDQTGGYHRNRHSKHKGKRNFTIKNKRKGKNNYSYSRKKYRNTGRTTHKNKLRSKKLKKSHTYRK